MCFAFDIVSLPPTGSERYCYVHSAFRLCVCVCIPGPGERSGPPSTPQIFRSQFNIPCYVSRSYRVSFVVRFVAQAIIYGLYPPLDLRI